MWVLGIEIGSFTRGVHALDGLHPAPATPGFLNVGSWNLTLFLCTL